MGKAAIRRRSTAARRSGRAILASTLTHIAVFVPMLFLTGVSSVLFGQLAVVVIFSLAMSLFVAVTIVPVLCSRVLRLPPPAAERRGLTGRPVPPQRAAPRRHRRRLRAGCSTWPCTTGRRSFAVGIAAFVAAVFVLPRGRLRAPCRRPTRARSPSTPSSPSAPASSGPRRCSSALEDAHPPGRAGGDDAHHPGRRRRHGRRLREQRHQPRQHHRAPGRRKDERERSSEQIAMDLRRQLSGLPGVVIRARASGGLADARHWAATTTRRLVGRDPRPRPRRSARLARDAKALIEHDARASPTSRLGRDEGRPELAVRVDRDKAAMLGLTVTGVADDHPHQRRRHPGGDLPRARQRVPDRGAAARGGSRARSPTSTTCWSARPAAGCSRPRTSWSSTARPARRRSTARTRSGSCA